MRIFNCQLSIINCELLIVNYSALRASMGRILAALRAGMSPAMVPAMIITRVASMQTSSPTVGLTNMEVDWNTPWSITISYNLSYTSSLTYAAFMGIATNRVTNTLGINGDISLTPNWKVTFMTGWDFTNKGLSNTNLSIYRDLHCWEMRFSWTPIGYYKSWNFTINVKAQALKDLKLTKKKDYRDNL